MSFITVRQGPWLFTMSPSEVDIQGQGVTIKVSHQGMSPDQLYGFALGWNACHAHPVMQKAAKQEFMSNGVNTDW